MFHGAQVAADPRELRRRPAIGAGGLGEASRRAGQLRQPRPDRGAEDGCLRDLRAAGRRADVPVHARGERREHHGLLARVPGISSDREDRPAAPDDRLAGGRRGAHRPGARRGEARDDRLGHPDRESGELAGGDGRRCGSPTAPSTRSRTRRSSTPTVSWRSLRASFCEPASAASVAGLVKWVKTHGFTPSDRVVLHPDRPRVEGSRHGGEALGTPVTVEAGMGPVMEALKL